MAQEHCWLPPADKAPLPYMLIFALIEFTTCVMSVTTNILMYMAALRASRALFARMLDSVTHATTRWLDKTPSGQILNRFGKDIESLDSGLLQSASTVLFQIFSLATSFITLSVLVPGFILPSLGVIYIYYSRTSLRCSSGSLLSLDNADFSFGVVQYLRCTLPAPVTCAGSSRLTARPSSAATPSRSRVSPQSVLSQLKRACCTKCTPKLMLSLQLTTSGG